MALKATCQKRIFHFGFDARTSRGAMKERASWFIKLFDEAQPEVFGIGECAPLKGLSTEKIEGLDEVLSNTVGRISYAGLTVPTLKGQPKEQLSALHSLLKEYFSEPFLMENPSIVFALETALLDLVNGGSRVIFENSFIKGVPIPINGLIWMGGLDFMLQQIEIKVRDGFNCLKIKVGGIDFEKDCDILQYVRRKYFRDKITVRLDANGFYKPDDALYKLKELSKYDIHSIEQPVKAGAKDLPEICKNSAIPVALDEELIGVTVREDKEKLLDRIKPAFIILKPTLHGAMYGCQEWIELAEERKIGWWITSALESSVGLNAVSQFACNYDIKLHQGLGTGEIYTDNIPSPLKVEKGNLLYDSRSVWDLGGLE